MVQLNFNASDVKDDEPIKPGDYECQIVDTDLKTTKRGDGQYLELKVQVVEEGDECGRMVWDRLNIVNPNKTAEQIAHRQLAQLCKAVDILELDDSDELIGTPFIARISVEPARGDYGPSNGIKKYLSV